MSVTASRTVRASLRKLPTTRPVVDPADVRVPEGYEVEPVLVGLSFQCGMECADDGSLSSWESAAPGRPGLPRRGREDPRSATDPEYMLEMGPVSILHYEDA